MSVAFICVALLFFLGHALEWVFSKTKIPDVLALIGLGYLIGPVFGVLSLADFGKVGPFLTTLALVVILYEGGVRLRAVSLLRSSLPAIGLSVIGFFVTGAAAAVLTLIFQPWPVALLVGLGVGSTSSAVVIPMVRMLNMNRTTKTVLSLESAFTDVLVIVTFLVALEAIASGEFDMAEVLIGIGPKTFQAVLMGIGAGLFWAFLKNIYQPLTEVHFAGEAFACLVFGLLDYTGFNGAMGVLALGFTLSNLDLLPDWAKGVFSKKPVTRDEMELLGAITFLLKTYFFIYLGLMIQSVNPEILLVAFLISVIIFSVRYLAVRAALSPAKYGRVDAMTAMAMGPRGLACAVLASLPLQHGIAGGQWIQATLVSVIPMTIVLTSLFVMLADRPAFRLRMLWLFGTYREDFGIPALNRNPEPPQPQEPTPPQPSAPPSPSAPLASFAPSTQTEPPAPSSSEPPKKDAKRKDPMAELGLVEFNENEATTKIKVDPPPNSDDDPEDPSSSG